MRFSGSTLVDPPFDPLALAIEGGKRLASGGLLIGMRAETDHHALIARRHVDRDVRVALAAPHAVIFVLRARRMMAFLRIEIGVMRFRSFARPPAKRRQTDAAKRKYQPTSSRSLFARGSAPAELARDRRPRAACCASKHAIVIGPTPPGTGVIAPATSTASAKATSPTMRDLPPAPGTRLMPTSITVAPGLIQSPRTNSGLPIAANKQIGAAADRRQIARLRMRDRHGGVSASSSCASGLPTMLERPTTTASSPASDGCTAWQGSRSRAACTAPAPAGRSRAARH